MHLARKYLERLDVDAILLTSLADVRWTANFTGSNGLLFVFQDDAVLVTDGRYRTQAASEVFDAKVVIGGHDLIGHAADVDLLSSCRRVAFQSDAVTVAKYEALVERFDGIEWVDAEELLVTDVASKADEEVERMREAQRLTDTVFEAMLPAIRPGMTEIEVAAEIVYRHLKHGAERMAFEPIVASGPNSALPHAQPTARILQHGDVLLLDFGCFLDGYASDMTRTIALGEPGSEVREVYEVVLAAQRSALNAARSRIRSSDLDAAARDVIAEAGYELQFPHSLGHGVGLQVHEWPRISHTAEYLLPDGCVITIEPGIYLPDRFGVRIEDMVRLLPNECENLTNAPKELIVL